MKVTRSNAAKVLLMANFPKGGAYGDDRRHFWVADNSKFYDNQEDRSASRLWNPGMVRGERFFQYLLSFATFLPRASNFPLEVDFCDINREFDYFLVSNGGNHLAVSDLLLADTRVDVGRNQYRVSVPWVGVRGLVCYKLKRLPTDNELLVHEVLDR